TKEFFSPYLGAYVDISHLFIIAAGNSSIKDPALLSRLDPHKIEKFKDAVNEEDEKEEVIQEINIIEDDVNEVDIKKMGAKAKVIWNSIIPKLAQNEEPMWNLDPTNLSNGCKRDIQKAITEDPEIGLRWIEIRLIKILNNERRGVYIQ
ncbi:MAG: hypothetical protein Q8K37_01745, partial [Alphaproteobacteria bacterium]|nr:hypothetical protein [Alphaproteobacteria bacterium]